MDEVTEQVAEVIAEAAAPVEAPPEVTLPEEPAIVENIVEPTSELSAENSEAGFFVAQNQEEAPAAEPEFEPITMPETPVHDWESEWAELARVHPEVIGQKLPDDIYQACIESAERPVRVYEQMMLAKKQEEIDDLRAQIATLKQNAEAAARAPVSASAGTVGAQEGEDPFLKAFNSY